LDREFDVVRSVPRDLGRKIAGPLATIMKV
jgi:hypothetical protein